MKDFSHLNDDDRRIALALRGVLEADIERAVSHAMAKLFGAVEDVEGKFRLLSTISTALAALDGGRVERLAILIDRAVRNSGQADEKNILHDVIDSAWRWHTIRPYLRRGSVVIAAIAGYGVANADKIAGLVGL